MSATDRATETTIHRTVPGSDTGFAPSPSPFEQLGVAQSAGSDRRSSTDESVPAAPSYLSNGTLASI